MTKQKFLKTIEGLGYEVEYLEKDHWGRVFICVSKYNEELDENTDCNTYIHQTGATKIGDIYQEIINDIK